MERTGTHSVETTHLKRWTEIIAGDDSSPESLDEVLKQINSGDPSAQMILAQSAWTLLMAAADNGDAELEACIDVVKHYADTLENCAFSDVQNTCEAGCGCLGFLPPGYLSRKFTAWISSNKADNESKLAFVSSASRVAGPELYRKTQLGQLLLAVEESGSEEQQSEARSFRANMGEIKRDGGSFGETNR